MPRYNITSNMYCLLGGISGQHYSLGGLDELAPLVLIGGVRVLPTQVLGDLTGGKLGLAHVAKVAREMDRLACENTRKQSSVKHS